MTGLPPICVAVLAHQEEARIATCMHSLPLGHSEVAIHIVVNGSTDRTANIARAIASGYANVIVHEFEEGGKSRSWNRFVFDTLPAFHAVHVFVDGDAQISSGSVESLADSLNANPHANAAAGLPLNGRKMARYQEEMRRDRGLFGDLYALNGKFLARMKAANIRLPDDLIGDDGLLAALTKTDLATETNWDNSRVLVCEKAGFICEPVRLLAPESWHLQYKRMINYSIRHFQNRMISRIMRGPGPAFLPTQLRELYRQELSDCTPRRTLPEFWFDHVALRRMAAKIST